MTNRASPPGLLRALGIVGWESIEPVILAALATEAPLLLIGPHGSGKTLVLTRLAEALGLEHRHYNASLLNFDDLIGFPIPQEGKLVYLETPATIWNAESVFFDEVSRCRPELQNKLFPIVHERRVQGVSLPRLRHRWAAMNPAPNAGHSGDNVFEYAGAEPLDVALADRFAFIVCVPDLQSLSPSDQRAVLDPGEVAAPAIQARLVAVLETTRSRLASVQARFAGVIGEYVPVVAQKLALAQHPISTRRAVQIARNIEAIAAACEVRGEAAPADDMCYVALRHSLPDEAWGRRIDAAALLAIHRAAWDLATLSDPALKHVLSEADPVRRIAAAIDANTLSLVERGQVVADSYASLDRPGRLATAAFLMPRLADSDLPAATLEVVAADYASIAAEGKIRTTVRNGGADWKRPILGQWLGSLDGERSRRDAVLGNVAAVLLRDDIKFTPRQLEDAVDHASACLRDAP